MLGISTTDLHIDNSHDILQNNELNIDFKVIKAFLLNYIV